MLASPVSSESSREVVVNTSNGPKMFEISKLGGGGYNNAFLAREKSTPEDAERFVLKIYISGQENDNREAQILGVIRRHNGNSPIVNIIDPKVSMGNSQGHIESLARGKKLQDQLPSTRQALELAIGFARLLKTCAEADVAYRDIKPGDHVFWEPEPDRDSIKNMTVIDWNISQYPASVGALYFDLTTFCKYLPEFFTGRPPEGGAGHYHPLTWQFSQAMQSNISPKLWLMLANLSMNFVTPILPDGEKLLSTSALSKETVIDSWNKIIQNLEAVLICLDGPELPALGVETLDDHDIYLEGCLHPTDGATRKKWTNDLIYTWASVDVIATPSSYIRPSDPEELIHLRMARFLNPGEFREAILLALFVAVYRTGLYNDPAAATSYRKLLQDLLEQKPPALIYDKQAMNALAIAAREKAAQHGPDVQEIHGEIWENLSKEFANWVACDEFEREPDIEKKEKLAKALDHFHPVSSFHLQTLEATKRTIKQKNDIDKATADGLFEFAVLIAEQLRNTDPDAANERLKLIELCKRLQNLRDEQENATLIKNLLDDLGDHPLPPTFAEDANTLRKRLPSLQQKSVLKQEIEQAANLTSLQDVHQKITSLQENMHPSLKEAWAQKFSVVKTNIITPLKSDLEKLKGMTRVSKLRELSSELGKMLELCRTSQETVLAQALEKEKRETDSEIDKIHREIRDSAEQHKKEFAESLASANHSASAYERIQSKLEAIALEKDIFDDSFKLWLNESQQKVNTFLTAAIILENFHQNQQDEATLNTSIERLNNYPDDGHLLQQKLKDFRNENDLRHKLVNDVHSLSTLQANSFDTLTKQLVDVPQKIDETSQATVHEIGEKVQKEFNSHLAELQQIKTAAGETKHSIQNDLKPSIAALNTQLNATHASVTELKQNREDVGSDIASLNSRVKRMERVQMIAHGATFIFFMSIIAMLALIMSGFSFSSLGLNPTATPAQTEETVETSTTVPIATLTIPSRPGGTGTPIQKTGTPDNQPTSTTESIPAENIKMRVKPDAVFLAEDLKTELWTVFPSIPLTEVTILEDKGQYYKVQLEIVVGKSILNGNNLTKGNYIRSSHKSGEEYTKIGLINATFAIEKKSELPDGWELVIFTGWVSKEFLK